MYIGEWIGGIRMGYGKMTWEDGTYYDGEWKYGKAEGKGFLSYNNGNYVKGEFKYNKLNGHGESFNADVNYRYTGQWINDLQYGQGIESWGQDGSEYIGLFENGNKEGFGKYTWGDTSYFIGEWKDNKINGLVSFFNFREFTAGLMEENL